MASLEPGQRSAPSRPGTPSGDGDSGSFGGTVTAGLVAGQLREQILAGEFLPGERLGQEMLAERFRTSRMPVRTALRQLEAEGLVTVVRNSGAWVSKLDHFEFIQAYKMREAIEPLAIRESVAHLTEEDLDRLGELAERLDGATHPKLNVESFLELDRQFHLLTYAGVRHRPLKELVERLWNTTQHYRRALVRALGPNQSKATAHDHALILDAVRRRDAESAGVLVRLHIYRTRQILDGHVGIFD